MSDSPLNCRNTNSTESTPTTGPLNPGPLNPDPLNRREMLKWSALAAGFGAVSWPGHAASARDYEEPVPEARGLTVYDRHNFVLFRNDNQPLTVYRARTTQKYPYFFPTAGPVSGLSVTTESCLPYPHHRGLWLGLDPLNGGNYWSDGPLEEGHIESTGRSVVDQTEDSVTSRPPPSTFWKNPGALTPANRSS